MPLVGKHIDDQIDRDIMIPAPDLALQRSAAAVVFQARAGVTDPVNNTARKDFMVGYVEELILC